MYIYICYVMLFISCVYIFYILDVNFKFRKQNAHLCSVIAGHAPFIPHLPSCIHLLCGPQDHSTLVMFFMGYPLTNIDVEKATSADPFPKTSMLVDPRVINAYLGTL